jgi:predicted secreted Zn-dependent protease
VLAALVVTAALSATVALAPTLRTAENTADHQFHDSALAVPIQGSRSGVLPEPSPDSTGGSADGAGAGGSLASHSDGRALTADPPGAPSGQTASAAPGPVQVTSATTFYAVEGADVRSLLASLRQRGPADRHGTWAASTSWVFRWSYEAVAQADCRVQRAGVALDLTYTYPQWTPPLGASDTLIGAWQGYLARVELHEHGHRDIAQGAAAELVRTLETLPAQATCDALADSARAAAEALLTRHNQAQITYDRETRHGATQGAVLSE